MNLAPLEIDRTYAPLVDITPSRLFFTDPFAKNDLQYSSELFGRNEFQPDQGMYLPPPEIYSTYPQPQYEYEYDTPAMPAMPMEMGLPTSIDFWPEQLAAQEGPSRPERLSEDILSPEALELAQFEQEMDARNLPAPTKFMREWLTVPKLRNQSYWNRGSNTKCALSGCKLSHQTNLELQAHIHTHTDNQNKSLALRYHFCPHENCLHHLVGFKTQCNLDRHMRTAHTKRSATKCEWCLKSFNRKDSVVRHQLLKHCKNQQQPKKTLRKGLRSSSA